MNVFSLALNSIEWVLIVITALFVISLSFVGLILVCQAIAGRVRFARDVRAMHAELALITLDPSKGRLR